MLLSNEEIRHTILSILRDERDPMGSKKLSEKLKEVGIELSEAAIRYHLRILEERGYVFKVKNLGRKITQKGLSELERANVMARVSTLLTRKEEYMFMSNFNPETKKGKILVNFCKFKKDYLDEVIDIFKECYKRKLAISPLVKVIEDGELLSEDEVGMYYINGIAVDGVLLRRGINVHLRYGGVVEFKHGEPVRFIDMVGYETSSITSVDLFRAKSFSALSILTNGCGECPATFRVIPGICYQEVIDISAKLKKCKINGFLKIGKPNQEVLGLPVNSDQLGITIVASSTPLLILKEQGINVELELMVDVIDYELLEEL